MFKIMWKSKKIYAEAERMVKDITKEYIKERGVPYPIPKSFSGRYALVAEAIVQYFELSPYEPIVQVLKNVNKRINHYTWRQASLALADAKDKVANTLKEEGYEGLLT